ncbi:MAG: MMPL family transporter [Alphaproteobacteria bacterium]
MVGYAIIAYRRLLELWIILVSRHPRSTLVLCVAATVALGAYAGLNLGVNTSTQDLIAEDVPFRQHDKEFEKAFPQFDSVIIAVIEGGTAEQRELAARKLACAMDKRYPHLFEPVYARKSAVDCDAEDFLERGGGYRTAYLPSNNEFFLRNGLLYLDLPELERLANRLAASQGLIAILNEDPSLRGFAEVISLALSPQAPADAISELEPVLQEIADVVNAQLAGVPRVMSWRDLVSGDPEMPGSDRQFILAQPVREGGAFAPATQALKALRALAPQAGITPDSGLTMRITGAPALEQEELRTVRDSTGLAGLLSLALVTVLLIWGLRSGSMIAGVLLPLLMGLIWTAGFAAWAIGHLNLISVAFAVLFVGLSVDFGIHFSLRFREELNRGAERLEALKWAVRSVGIPLTLAAICAAIGFFAFVPTDYRGLAELGIIAGASMFVALLANLTVLPALLSLARMPDRTAPTGVAGTVSRFVRDHPRQVMAVTVAVVLVSALLTPRAQFDFNPLNLQDPDKEAVSTYRALAEDPSTSPYKIQVLAESLERANEIKAKLKELDEVGRAITLSDFVPENQDEKFFVIEDMALFLGPAVEAVERKEPPNDAELAGAVETLMTALRSYLERAEEEGGTSQLQKTARLLLLSLRELVNRQMDSPEGTQFRELNRRLTKTLPIWLGNMRTAMRAQPFTIDGLPPVIRDRWVTEDGRARIEVWPAESLNVITPEDMQRFSDAVLNVKETATGTPVIVSEAAKTVRNAFLIAVGLTVLAITILLVLIERRAIDVLLTLMPLVFSALMLSAATVLLGMPFNFANVIVLPLLFALGVSSSIHLVMRRRQIGRSGDLLRSSTPRAVLFSALTTVASFGSLSISAHRGMSSMGLLLTLAIVLVLISSLVVLPAFMNLAFDKKNRQRGRLSESGDSGARAA